jgi:putative DNA methylase
MPDDQVGLDAGGAGATAYSQAIGVYLAFVIEKLTECHTSLCTWSSAPKNELVVSTFRRQAIAMTWDFAESNPFADSSGSLQKLQAVSRVLPTSFNSRAWLRDSGRCTDAKLVAQKVVSTDPRITTTSAMRTSQISFTFG